MSFILYPFFCAKLFSARSVSARITTDTDKLTIITSLNGNTEKSGKVHCGSPVFTLSRVFIPYSLIGKKYVITAPTPISTTAIGNFGTIFLDTDNIINARTPRITDGIFILCIVSAICSASSKNSPVPAEPPSNFGSCINIIVVHIPVMKPPITGADM